MAIFIGYLAAGLIVLSLLSLLAVAVVAVMVAKSTVRANCADQVLRADLDRVLDQILSSTPSDPKLL
jgi:hypothetical protein